MEELRPEFIKEMEEIEKNNKITPPKLNDCYDESILYESKHEK